MWVRKVSLLYFLLIIHPFRLQHFCLDWLIFLSPTLNLKENNVAVSQARVYLGHQIVARILAKIAVRLIVDIHGG